MIGDKKEVYFNKYCPKCENKNVSADDPNGPCWDCLAEPAVVDSHKPINFKGDENEEPVNDKDI